MIECVFLDCDGLMKCQDETVSTMVCMCHYISHCVDLKHVQLSTEVQLIKAVCTA